MFVCNGILGILNPLIIRLVYAFGERKAYDDATMFDQYLRQRHFVISRCASVTIQSLRLQQSLSAAYVKLYHYTQLGAKKEVIKEQNFMREERRGNHWRIALRNEFSDMLFHWASPLITNCFRFTRTNMLLLLLLLLPLASVALLCCVSEEALALNPHSSVS
jgi:hypothetical protein